MNTNNVNKLREQAASAAGTLSYLLEPFPADSENELILGVRNIVLMSVRMGAAMQQAHTLEHVQQEEQKFMERLEEEMLKASDEFCKHGNAYHEGYADAVDKALQIFREM